MQAPAAPHLLGQRVQQGDRILPTNAGVGDALTVDERAARHEVLPPFPQVRFDHQADDSTGPLPDLLADGARDAELTLELFARVRMRAVDHQPLGDACRRHGRAGRDDRFCVVVGRTTATEDKMAVAVPARLDDGHLAVLVNREEVMLLPGGDDRVQGHFDVSAGPILEANRRREPRGEFAVDLRFGGPAPIAPQLIKSPMYCGEMVSRNSEPAGTPIW